MRRGDAVVFLRVFAPLHDLSSDLESWNAPHPRAESRPEDAVRTGLLFSRFASGLPAHDALGIMLHIRVAEVLGSFCSLSIRGAVFIGAIGDDKSALVGRQLRREIGLRSLEIERAGDVAFLVGATAVHVDERDFLAADRRL